MQSNLKPVEEGLFGSQTVFLPPRSIIIQTETNANLVVQDESPYQTQDQLDVPIHNVSTACVRGVCVYVMYVCVYIAHSLLCL